jgi:rhodanese-related sulfurtransferase
MSDETSLSPEQAQALLQSGAQLVDVRGEDEHAAGHISGDRHIRFDRLKDEVETLDQSRPLIVYCRSGDRSSPAADALRASGFEAFNIEGGALAWTEHGLPFDGQIVERNALPPA